MASNEEIANSQFLHNNVRVKSKLLHMEWYTSILANNGNYFLSIPFAWPHELIVCQFCGITLIRGSHWSFLLLLYTWQSSPDFRRLKKHSFTSESNKFP